MNTFLLKHHIAYKNKFSLEQIGVSFFNIFFIDIQVILKFLCLEKPNYVQTFVVEKLISLVFVNSSQ